MKGNKKEKKLPFWTQWVKLLIDTMILLVSVFAIFLTYLTLKEIKIQRIKNFEPELRILRADFKMNCIIPDKPEILSSFNFSIYTYTQNFDSSKIKMNDFYPNLKNDFKMPFINVGQSASLDIKTSFQIDTIYFLDFFNQFKVYLDGIDNLIIKDSKFAVIYNNDTSIIEDQFKPSNTFQYIPQYTGNKDTFTIVLPISYFKLLALRSFLGPKIPPEETYKGVSISEHLNNIPPILVTFTYKDINGLTYCSTSECYFNGLGIIIGISASNRNTVNYIGDMDILFKGKKQL